MPDKIDPQGPAEPDPTADSPRIDVDERVMGGVPCVRGTRIPVVTVLAALADDLSAETVVRNFPALDRDDVRACLYYAWTSVDYWRVAPPMSSQHLAASGQREAATRLVDHAAGLVDHPRLVVEALDLMAAVVLDIAGVDPESARAILATLWSPASQSDRRAQIDAPEIP